MSTNEGKPAKVFETLIKNYGLVDIFDCSPGSGALGTAALQAGIPVTSIVFDEVHHRWLSNIADLACAKLITECKSHLHQPSLSEALQNWFMDELEGSC